MLRALASSGRVLEINTFSPMASVTMLRWWRDEGGTAVSFGSDAHVASRVGDKFRQAVEIAEAAGFGRGRDRPASGGSDPDPRVRAGSGCRRCSV